MNQSNEKSSTIGRIETLVACVFVVSVLVLTIVTPTIGLNAGSVTNYTILTEGSGNITGNGNAQYVPVFYNETHITYEAEPFNGLVSHLYWTNPGYGDQNQAELVFDSYLGTGDFHLLNDGSCIRFSDNSRQCTAASGTGSGGNASITNFTTSSLAFIQDSTNIIPYAGSDSGGCSVTDSYITRVNLSANGTLGKTCTTNKLNYQLYSGGSATKLTANATYDYMLVGGAVGSSGNGQLILQGRACKNFGMITTISGFTLAGRMNATIWQNTTILCNAEFNITGNGIQNTGVLSCTGTATTGRTLVMAQYKRNGTFQVTNTIINLAC